MITRAIAPIVGANFATVSRDLKSPVANATPEAPAPLTDEPGQIVKLTGANSVASPGEELPKSEKIIGTDGKDTLVV